MCMDTLAASILGLLLGMSASHSALLAAAAPAVDDFNPDCEAAKKAAIVGVFFGTKTSKMGDEVIDNCVAAVFDPSGVKLLEANPMQNPKNYKCVGKNVRISLAGTRESSVTESWSASAKVPAGICSTQYCSGGYCNAAKQWPGLSSAIESQSFGGSEIPTEEQYNVPQTTAPVLLPREEAPALAERIDDAFTAAEAQKYEKDAYGIPDVTRPAYPGLWQELATEAHNINAMKEYERYQLPPEVRASPGYQELIRLNDEILAVPSIAEAWRQASFYFPDEPVGDQPQVLPPTSFNSGSTFTNPEVGFWAGWRRSENIEVQTWPEYIEANTITTIDNARQAVWDWYHTASYNVSRIWRSYFK